MNHFADFMKVNNEKIGNLTEHTMKLIKTNKIFKPNIKLSEKKRNSTK
jgi:hypothetical protein